MLKSNVGRIGRDIREAGRAAAHRTALDATDMIADSFAEPKSGREYYYGTASAPGESPAIGPTEDLINSLAVKRRGRNAYSFGATDEKAEWLEYGTARIEPRPFIGPLEKPVTRRLRQNLKNELKKV